jgi:hypothetical protein
MMSIFALLPLFATLLLIPDVLAQDKTVDNYPQWVTNDYNCGESLPLSPSPLYI